MQKPDIRDIIHLLRRKTLIVFIPLLLLPFISSAQLNYIEYLNKRIYFGITMGVNFANYKIVRSEEFFKQDSVLTISSHRGAGFHLGIITNLKVGQYLDLRFLPTLSIVEKYLRYEMLDNSIANKNIETISIEFPVSVRFKSQPIRDIRIYVLAGLKYGLDMASNAKARVDPARRPVIVSRHDLAYELGVGVQFFFPLFIFSPEVKVSNGFVSVLSRDENLIFSNVLHKLFSRGLVISLHFEG